MLLASIFRALPPSNGGCSSPSGKKRVTLTSLSQGARLPTGPRWKPRFDANGFAGIEHAKSHAALQPHCVDPAIAAEVTIALRRKNLPGANCVSPRKWRKPTVWLAIAPNSVRRVLIDGGLWPSAAKPGAKKKGAHELEPRYAPKPGQTVHIDLALSPAVHAPAEPIPAVSSSSGHPSTGSIPASRATMVPDRFSPTRDGPYGAGDGPIRRHQRHSPWPSDPLIRWLMNALSNAPPAAKCALRRRDWLTSGAWSGPAGAARRRVAKRA